MRLVEPGAAQLAHCGAACVCVLEGLAALGGAMFVSMISWWIDREQEMNTKVPQSGSFVQLFCLLHATSGQQSVWHGLKSMYSLNVDKDRNSKR